MYFAFGIYFYAIIIFSSVIVSFISLAIGVFALVSSKLFERVIEIKDENECYRTFKEAGNYYGKFIYVKKIIRQRLWGLLH